MKSYPGTESAEGFEKKYYFAVEGARAERILMLHWLSARRSEVMAFLRALNAEIRMLERLLTQDFGLDGEELRDIRRCADAARRAAELSPALKRSAAR